MVGDEDTKMGGTRELTSHASITHPPPPSRFQNTADPTPAPSFILQRIPEFPTSDSGPLQSHAPNTAAGIVSSEGAVKLSDSNGDSAVQLLRQDSLVESNSDWSDEGDESAKLGLAVGSLATGLCYDIRMRYHCEVNPTADVHPEDPRRIYYIYKAFCKAGLVEDPMANRLQAPQPLKRINARPATETEITLIHTDAHYAFVKSTKGIVSFSFRLTFWKKGILTHRLFARNGRP